MSGAAATAKAAKKKKSKRKPKNNEPAPKPWTGEEEESVTEHEDSENDEDYSDTNEERAKEYRKGGYHPVRVGELYNGRYRIVHKLGWGYFSTVWLAWDYDKAFPDPCPKLDQRCREDPETRKNYMGEPRIRDNLADPSLREVISPTALLSDDGFPGGSPLAGADFGGRTRGGWAAVKFQKSAPHYTDAARDEIRLLSRLSRTALDGHAGADPSRADRALMAPCCRLYDHFQHQGPNGLHYCMVFDVLGENLLQPIIGTNYRGLAAAWKDGVAVVKRMAAQLLRALDHAHRVAGVLHTDVKPENILFVAPPPSVQKVIREYDPPNDRGFGTRLEDRDPSTITKSQLRRLRLKVKSGKLEKDVLQKLLDARAHKDKDDPADEKEKSAEEKDADAAAAGEKSADDVEAPVDDADRPVVFVAGADESAKADPRGPLAPCYVLSRGESVRETGADQYVDGHRPAHVVNGAIAVADFGNACWVETQYTEEVQTRQYRAPEVIIGAGYGTAIDVWSVACVVFELLTGEFLFEPKGPSDGSDSYSRDDDHLALIIELVGGFPPHMCAHGARPPPPTPLAYWLRESNIDNGPYPFVPGQGPHSIEEAESTEPPADLLRPQLTDAPLSGASPRPPAAPRDRSKFFDYDGNLLLINGLKSWSLYNVLTDKYNFTPIAAREITSFLIPMLHPDPRCRPSAGQMLRHPWLTVRACDFDASAKGPTRGRDDPPPPPPPLSSLPWWATQDWTQAMHQQAIAPPPPPPPPPFDAEIAASDPQWCLEFFNALQQQAKLVGLKEPKPPKEDGTYNVRTIQALGAVFGIAPESIPMPLPSGWDHVDESPTSLPPHDFGLLTRAELNHDVDPLGLHVPFDASARPIPWQEPDAGTDADGSSADADGIAVDVPAGEWQDDDESAGAIEGDDAVEEE